MAINRAGDHFESAEVDGEPGEELEFGVDPADPPEECDPGECVEGEDVAVPEEVAVDEPEEEEPSAPSMPESCAGVEFGVELARSIGSVELAGVHDNARAEEQGEDEHELAQEKHAGGLVGSGVCRRIGDDGGIRVGGAWPGEGDDVGDEDAQEGEAPEGVDGLEPIGRLGWCGGGWC